jgi:hypothetical protein
MSIACKILGHQMVELRKLSDKTSHIGCNRCLKYWGINDELRLVVEFDEDLFSMYKNVFQTLDRLVA